MMPQFPCRITCGDVTVEGSTPQSAWQKLRGDPAAIPAKPSRQEGLQMFGLKHRTVCRRIHRLPGADRCEQYCGWPETGTVAGKGDAEGPRAFPKLVDLLCSPRPLLTPFPPSLPLFGWLFHAPVARNAAGCVAAAGDR